MAALRTAIIVLLCELMLALSADSELHFLANLWKTAIP